MELAGSVIRLGLKNSTEATARPAAARIAMPLRDLPSPSRPGALVLWFFRYARRARRDTLGASTSGGASGWSWTGGVGAAWSRKASSSWRTRSLWR